MVENKIGLPIEGDFASLVWYGCRKYYGCGGYIKCLLNRYHITDKTIVSIGSGMGSEEIIMTQLQNHVDCIEPDALSREVCIFLRDKWQAKGIQLFDSTVATYEVEQQYHLIYTSSPSDWAHTEDVIIPEEYLNFFKRYSRENGRIICVLYGGCHAAQRLRDRIFYKQVIDCLSAIGFCTREIWVDYDWLSMTFVAEKQKQTIDVDYDLSIVPNQFGNLRLFYEDGNVKF